MITRKIIPDLEILHSMFELRTDGLYRKKNGTKVGFRLRPGSYSFVHIQGMRYYVHRVVFKMKTGVEPPDFLDHINEDKGDDSPDNLRETDNGTNVRRGPCGRHKHLPTGVVAKKNGRFSARIRHGVYMVQVGTFDTAEEAGAAFQQAKKERDNVPCNA